jgi:hypothetical protein
MPAEETKTEAARTEAELRRERQATALRENLRRRKARERAKKSEPDDETA